MRKIRFLSFLLALIMLLPAVLGCNNGNTEETETQAPTVTGPLIINGVALKDYTVVCSNSAITGSGRAFVYLNKKLEALYGTTLEVELSNEDRPEILIGLDGDDEAIAAAYAQNQSGLIGVTGKKIVLLGANYSALCQVIDAFLAKATGDEESKEISISGYEIQDLNSPSLNVMTYNILFDMNKEGRESNCRLRMVTTILENDVDVLGTQEDGTGHSKYFIENLKTYDLYKGDIDEGNHIYWKKDRFTVKRKGYYFLSDTPERKSKYEGSNQYRTMTYVVLEENKTGKQFLFINTHLDYRATEEVRVKQIDALAALIKKVNKDDLPVIVLGDFNTTTTVSGSALLDFMGDNPNFGMTSKVAKVKGDTGPTLIEGNFTKRHPYVFDYIFVTTDTVYTRYYTVVNNIKNGKYPSDHLPVLAKVDIY
ncbi:MAG: hypothetical protein E7577_00140 [Ruminococcaceae bacterium]|nr:hypothetical protein [Oscillospiraceae bacterium]